METMNPHTMYWIMFIGVAVISYLVQILFQRKIDAASRCRLNMSGRDVAQKMLSDHGISNVRIISTNGRLTDNFNPSDMTVNLSEAVYDQYNAAAAAVAAHECGHAVQHATGYGPIRLRSALVPVVSFASRAVTWVLLAGMFLINIFPQLMLFGIILFAMTTLFSFVTLPVEINASRRALAWLDRSGITDSANHAAAEGALRAAAYTYVVGALSSLATLIYYILIFTSGRRN